MATIARREESREVSQWIVYRCRHRIVVRPLPEPRHGAIVVVLEYDHAVVAVAVGHVHAAALMRHRIRIRIDPDIGRFVEQRMAHVRCRVAADAGLHLFLSIKHNQHNLDELGVLKDVLVTIIERNEYVPRLRVRSLSQVAIGASNEAFSLQLPHLLFEQFRTDMEALESDAPGAGSNVMISKNPCAVDQPIPKWL